MNRKESALIGSLVADAMALGPHWIYDTEKIKSEFGEIERLTNPLKDSFHPTKEAGDFTHYGDLMVFMMEYLQSHKRFDKRGFLEAFEQYMQDYKGYKDHAMKETFENIQNDHWIGSDSRELGGLCTLPIFNYFYESKDSIEPFIQRLKATHNNALLIEIAMFIFSILEQLEFGHSIKEAVIYLKPNVSTSLDSMIDRVFEALKEDESTEKVIKEFGQMCDATNAFPSMLYLSIKYQNNFEKAIIENIKAGGDSAARGIILGTLLGTYLGRDVIPKTWINQLNKIKVINEFLRE